MRQPLLTPPGGGVLSPTPCAGPRAAGPPEGRAKRAGPGRRVGVGPALGAALAVALQLAPAAARAQALKDNRYAIDLFQGPVLAPSDVIGIGGAYAGVAEGIAGMVSNAAAPAVRESYDVGWIRLGRLAVDLASR